VHHSSRSVVAAERPLPGDHDPSKDKRAQFPLLIYSVACGAISVMIGAVLSFAASGSGRLLLWSAVTSACGIVAGIAYKSRLITFWYSAFARWMRHHGQPS
jgi:hypothetical protein